MNMNRKLFLLVCLAAWVLPGQAQNTVESIRQRYADEKAYIEHHTGDDNNDGSDWAEYYTAEDQINPQGPRRGNFRIFRGGSRFNSTRLCRVSYRLCRYDYNDDNLSGFRLVLDTSEVNQKILGR